MPKETTIEDIYPLSPTQQGLLFHTLFDPQDSVYFEQVTCTLQGDLKVEAFERAWQETVDRNPILRTAFAWEGREKPLQIVRRQVRLPWVREDWRHLPRGEQAARWRAWLSDDRRQGFDLSRAPLMRLALMQLADDTYHFAWSHHHILLDGWSMSLVFQEVLALYQAYSQGCDPALDRRRLYRDYIVWLQTQDGVQAEAYWRQTLAGFTTPISLGVERRQPAGGADYGEQSATLSIEATASLRAFAQSHQLTVNTLVQGAWALLLSRYSGASDVVFGSVVSGRPPTLPGSETMIGLFINTLPMRVRVPMETPVLHWLQDLQARQVEMRQYEHSALAHIQGWSEVPRGQPLFQTILAFENYPTATSVRQEQAWVEVKEFHFDERTNYPLSAEARPGPQLRLEIAYDTRYFDAPAIGRMLGQWQMLVEALAARPGQPISALPELTAEERQRVLLDWNNTAVEFPLGQCLPQLFEAQVQRTPGAVAVVCGAERLSYGELNARANRLARLLVEQGVGPECVVALLAERGPALLAAILAVFKAGGAYLPLDPRYPAQRLRQMLTQSGTALVVRTPEFEPTLAQALSGIDPGARPRILDLEALSQASAGGEDLPARSSPRNLAYVIYTSGSTGLPKGAMVEQQGMVNHLYVKIKDLELTAADRVAQTASQCFDISVWQFLAALVVGGEVHIFEDVVAHDPVQLLAHVDLDGITVLETVPSLMRAMLETAPLTQGARPSLASLRWLIPTGEALPPELCREWLRVYPRVPLINAYGPTECSDDVTHHVVHQPPEPVAHMPIGRPVANMRLYILDRRLRLAPIGVVGELFIGGVGVGRGYLHDPQRTADAFLPDPFAAPTPSLPLHHLYSTKMGDGGGRLYKTGDLARYLPDGTIEYLGRLDHQVKIRGHRIELGEIEAVLGGHPAVRQVVVVTEEAGPAPESETRGPGVKRLVAYVVFHPESESGLALGELRGFLLERLPDYMVPALFVVLDALPLTPNGKIDRKALPAPQAADPGRGRAFVAPQTPIEVTLSEIWSKVLGARAVGIHDNFFELGGDSILSLQIIARAHQAGLRITPRQIFQYPTIAELASVVGTAPTSQAEQGPVTGPVPLLPIQRWFFEQKFAEPHHWNASLFLEVRLPLDPALLAQAVRHLLIHHDALRMRFRHTPEAGWQQMNAAPETDLPFHYEDVSGLPEQERKSAIEAKALEAQASLDLTNGPLLRVAYFHCGEALPGRLLLVAHHLVVDGVSWRVLLEDLQTACEQLVRGEPVVLPSKTTSFKQWAERLEAYGRSPAVTQAAPYWLAYGRKTVRRLPVDRVVGESENSVATTRTVRSVLTVDETRALLHTVPQAYQTQITEVLLTALAQGFESLTGARQLLVDLEGHGREDLFEGVDVSRTVGWFTALYPVLLDLGTARDPGPALKAIKEQLRQIPDRGLSYGLLLDRADDAPLHAQLRALPKAEVSFNYLGQLDQAVAAGAFGPAPEAGGPAQSPRGHRPYLLEVDASITGEQLRFVYRYSEAVHSQPTVERLAGAVLAALRLLIAHCQAPGAGGYTPSDFPLARLDEAGINRVLGTVEFEE